MKLQLAFDFGDLSDLIALAERLGDLVDWIEVGTHLIMQEGIGSVSAFRQAFPNKTIVADLKIVDAGAKEAELAFGAGANIITVLGCAADATITTAVEQARTQHGQVMLDLLGVSNKSRCARKAEALGVDFICVHTAWDERQSIKKSLTNLMAVAQATRLPVVIAGGISLKTVPLIFPYRPHAIIVGRGITMSPDPVATAREFRALMLAAGREST
jgi:3-hexulose-6-phosphate synthase